MTNNDALKALEDMHPWMPEEEYQIIRTTLIQSAKVDELVKASTGALNALKTASRMLSEEHRVVLRGKEWGGSDIYNLEQALTKFKEK